MKALIQRVSQASVSARGSKLGSIGRGLLVLLCAVVGDTKQDVDYTVKKVSQLRIFEDDAGKMNRSVIDVRGEVLVISQFTLAAVTRKGNRPSFAGAEEPAAAERMYSAFISGLRQAGVPVQTGVFAQAMAVSLTNEGPVTIMVDSRDR